MNRTTTIIAVLTFALTGGCSNTFIDLSPDASDDTPADTDTDTIESEAEPDAEPEADATEPDDVTDAPPDEAQPDILPDVETTDTTPDEASPADDAPSTEAEADADPDEAEDTSPPDDAGPDADIEPDVSPEADVPEAEVEAEPDVPPEADAPPEDVEPEAEADAPPDTPAPTLICSNWDTPGTDIAPFTPADFLWVGTVNPRRNVNWVQATDRVALFYVDGGPWRRVLATYTLVLPGVSPLPSSSCLRHVWHSGLGDFIVEYSPTTSRFVSLDRTASWAPSNPIEVQEEQVCDPATGAGWSEYRVDGHVAVHTTTAACSAITTFAMAVVPGYLAECGSTAPHPPARPLVTYGPLAFRSFCFLGEPW